MRFHSGRLLWAGVILATAALVGLLLEKAEGQPGQGFAVSAWTAPDQREWLFLPSWLQGQVPETAEGQTVALASANLPVVSIVTDGGDMGHFQEGKTVTETGEMTVFEADGSLTWRGKLKEIRSRGNTTLWHAKQPFQIRLDRDFGLLGMASGGTWLLLANSFDDSGIRNMIALDMANAAGMEYVPRWRCVDLYCNGVYWGTYLLTEKIEVQKGRVEVGNGFLIEREFAERADEQKDGFVSGEGEYYVQHFPKNGQDTGKIKALVDAFEAAVRQPDGRHPDTGRYYTDYMDLESFARKYVLEEILLNVDGGASSAFYYSEDGERLCAGPPWDYDLALGNCLDENELVQDPRAIAYGGQQGEAGTRIYQYLWQHEDFRETVKSVYRQDFRPFLESLVNGGVDRYGERILASWLMNGIRWQEVGNLNHYYDSYLTEYRYLKYFLDMRQKALDREWLGIDGQEDRSGLWKTGETHQIIYAVDGAAWRFDEVPDGTVLDGLPVVPGYEEKEMRWIREENDRPVNLDHPIFEDEIFIWQEK